MRGKYSFLIFSILINSLSAEIRQVYQYQNASNQCNVANCKLCPTLPDICQECDPSYYLVDPANCTNCAIPFCTICKQNAGAIQCTACDTKYLLKDNSCIFCQNIVQNCTTCNPDNYTCDQCSQKYYRNNSGKQCVLCNSQIPNCLSCSLDSQHSTKPLCSACMPNTFFINASFCEPCKSHIANCSKCDVNAGTCLTCAPGFYVDGGICILCRTAVDNCLYCKGIVGNIICTTCISDPKPLIVAQNKCQDCSVGVSDCSWCTQDNYTMDVTCNLCTNGKVLSGDECVDSDPDTIVIASSVIGSFILLGAGVTVLKCLKKRKMSTLLTQEEY